MAYLPLTQARADELLNNPDYENKVTRRLIMDEYLTTDWNRAEAIELFALHMKTMTGHGNPDRKYRRANDAEYCFEQLRKQRLRSMSQSAKRAGTICWKKQKAGGYTRTYMTQVYNVRRKRQRNAG